MKAMGTKIIQTSHENAIDLARIQVRQGNLIAFPTDTVYGLAADLHNASAIEKLFIAKGRDFNKAIAVLIATLDQLPTLTPNFSSQARIIAEHFWPGALTIIVEKNPSLPAILSPFPTLGIRMPDHPFASKLLRAAGPLATTSANLSGSANPLTARDVLAQLAGRVSLVLDGGACPAVCPPL